METIKVGVVGVGHLGRHHARVYTEILGAELVGVVDTDPTQAEAIGRRLGVPYYTDTRRFVEECRPEAVSVVVPTVAHFQVAQELMARGVHVIVEKPVTTTVQQASELLDIAKKRHLVLQVGHIERFNSAIAYLAQEIKEPLCIQSRRQGPFSPRISDVGVVMDLMIHDIDIILSLVKSEVQSISAVGRKVRTPHEDLALAQIVFKNGVIADIQVSRVAERRLRQMDIMEQDRYFSVNFETQDVSIHHCVHPNGDAGLMEVIQQPLFPKGEPLKLELQHFISCVREGKQPLVGISDGKKALELAVAVLKQIHLQ